MLLRINNLITTLVVILINDIGGINQMEQQNVRTRKQIKEKYTLHTEKSFNKFIAATFNDFGKQENNRYFDEKLMIFQNDTLIFSIEEMIRDYCWNDVTGELVFLTVSEKKHSGLGAPADGVGIFDPLKLSYNRLFNIEKHINIFQLNYANFNNTIYAMGLSDERNIYHLDIRNKKLELTPYKGMNFSPEGKYYTNFSFEGEPIVLYERATNHQIWNSTSSEFLNFPRFVGWVIQNERCFLYLQGQFRVGKINCYTGTVEKFFDKPKLTSNAFLENDSLIWK